MNYNSFIEVNVMKKYISIIISALIICSTAACSSNSTESSVSEETSAAGAASVIVDSANDNTEGFTKIDTADLPSKLDLRNYNG